MHFQNSNPVMPSTLNTINGSYQSTTSQSNQYLNYQNSASLMPSLANTTYKTTMPEPNSFTSSQYFESANLNSSQFHGSSSNQALNENLAIQVNSDLSVYFYELSFKSLNIANIYFFMKIIQIFEKLYLQ